MAVSSEFLDYLLDQLSAWGGVSARKMFGGAGLFRNGKMFALIANDIAYLKAGDSNRDEFVRRGSRPFKPYPGKKTLMPYFEIPADVLEDPDQLIDWAKRSLAIAEKGRS
jgi:DNA transformation protein